VLPVIKRNEFSVTGSQHDEVFQSSLPGGYQCITTLFRLGRRDTTVKMYSLARRAPQKPCTFDKCFLLPEGRLAPALATPPSMNAAGNCLGLTRRTIGTSWCFSCRGRSCREESSYPGYGYPLASALARSASSPYMSSKKYVVPSSSMTAVAYRIRTGIDRARFT